MNKRGSVALALKKHGLMFVFDLISKKQMHALCYGENDYNRVWLRLPNFDQNLFTSSDDKYMISVVFAHPKLLESWLLKTTREHGISNLHREYMDLYFPVLWNLETGE